MDIFQGKWYPYNYVIKVKLSVVVFFAVENMANSITTTEKSSQNDPLAVTLSYVFIVIVFYICVSVCRFVEGNTCRKTAHCFVLFMLESVHIEPLVCFDLKTDRLHGQREASRAQRLFNMGRV